MWSEFGNETGYNIGFDSKRLIARIEENNTIEYHGLVLYEMEEQKKIVRRILNEGIPNEMQLSFSEIIEAGAKNRDCEEYKKACRKFQKITAIYALCHVFQKQCLSGGAGISVYLQKEGDGSL